MIKILILTIFILFTSCSQNSNDKKEESKMSKEEKENFSYEIADAELKYDREKIILLSIAKNISQEKTSSVLRDYYAKTNYFGSGIIFYDENPDYLIKVIDSVALNNKLSKQQTASIIFSYKYELLTKDEIIEDYQNERDDYYNEYQQESSERN